MTVEAESSTAFALTLERQPMTALLDSDKTCYRWATPGSARADRVALGEAQ